MTEWIPSRTPGKWGEHSQYVWIGPYQVLVFKRKYGWAYTVRAEMSGNRWCQIASGSTDYYINPEIAKLAAMASLGDLQLMMTEEAETIRG